ncbi:DUF6764 family protein [Jongsikchunia kroppenstedtii]|uniref:DUF6764 family protein n=1 Tax=Jongsikchunia kroppenstedtii TaxID=1121721 RepID=UPI0009D95EF0|nr:DUF6764 family protein [Jongsikchunia kroppenstedtii]
MKKFAHGVVIVAGFASTAAAATLFATGTATAAPGYCPAYPGQATYQSGCSATADPTGTAAGIADTGGHAAATAGPNGLSLGIGLAGGTATSQARDYSGPAAIALGPGANATAMGVRPGLSIAIAGSNATVTVDGKHPATCTDGAGFAGDFQTFSGCLNTGAGEIPLGQR